MIILLLLVGIERTNIKDAGKRERKEEYLFTLEVKSD